MSTRREATATAPEYLNSGLGEVRSKNGSLASYEKQAVGRDSKELHALKRDPLVN